MDLNFRAGRNIYLHVARASFAANISGETGTRNRRFYNPAVVGQGHEATSSIFPVTSRNESQNARQVQLVVA